MVCHTKYKEDTKNIRPRGQGVVLDGGSCKGRCGRVTCEARRIWYYWQYPRPQRPYSTNHFPHPSHPTALRE